MNRFYREFEDIEIEHADIVSISGTQQEMEERVEQAIGKFVRANYDIIFLCDRFMDQYGVNAARNFNDVAFVSMKSNRDLGDISHLRNFAFFDGKLYQVNYLTGYIAAKNSKTNKIGFLLSDKHPWTLRLANAWALGAQRANVDIKPYFYTLNSTEVKHEQQTIRTLLRFGCDVLSSTISESQIYDLVVDENILATGFEYDWESLIGDRILASAERNWNEMFFNFAKEVYTSQRFQKNMYFYGLDYKSWLPTSEKEKPPILLSKMSFLVERVVQIEIQHILESLQDGNDTIFCGPIYDTEDNLRILSGECESDLGLISQDFVVKGVEDLGYFLKPEDRCEGKGQYFSFVDQYEFDSKCFQCEKGTFNPGIPLLNHCHPCPKGTFSDELGLTECKVCSGNVLGNGTACTEKRGSELTVKEYLLIAGIVSFTLIFIIFCVIIIVILIILRYYKREAKKYRSLNHLEERLLELENNDSRMKMYQKNIEYSLKDIKLKKRIGSGGSLSVVFLGEWKKKTVAVKIFKATLVNSEEFFDDFERETKLLSTLRHPYIVKFYGLVSSPTKIGMIMEYCHNGTLSSFLEVLQLEGKKLKTLECLRFLHMISQGLSYLHSLDVIHRDLKCENIMLTEDNEIRIIDFGLSKSKNFTSKKNTAKIGSSYYMSPELIRGNDYDYKVDVYSFAMVAWELYTTSLNPFRDFENEMNSKYHGNQMPIEYRIAQEKLRPEMKPHSSTDAWLITLIRDCWEDDPQKRPTMESVNMQIAAHISKYL